VQISHCIRADVHVRCKLSVHYKLDLDTVPDLDHVNYTG